MTSAPTAPRLVLDHGVGEVAIEASGPLGSVLRRLAGLPAADRCRVEFHTEAVAAAMHWRRRYCSEGQASHCDTTITATSAGFIERRGPVVMEFDLTGDGQATLHSVRLLGVPLPRRMLSSRVESVATTDGLRTTVDVWLGRGRMGRLGYVANLSEVPA